MDLQKLEIARNTMETLRFKLAIDTLIYGDFAEFTDQKLSKLLIFFLTLCPTMKVEIYFALIEQIMLACPELPMQVQAPTTLEAINIPQIKLNVATYVNTILLAEPGIIHARDQYGVSLLMIAAATACESLVVLLLHLGADRDLKCRANGSPLGFKIGDTAAHFVLRAKFSPSLLSRLLSDANTKELELSLSYLSPWKGVGICERRIALAGILNLIANKVGQIDAVLESLHTQILLNRFEFDEEELAQDILEIQSQREYWLKQADLLATLHDGLERLERHHTSDSDAEVKSQLLWLRVARAIRAGRGSDTAVEMVGQIINEHKEHLAADARMRMYL